MRADLYLAKYNPESYHCVHFAFDLLKDLTGVEVYAKFKRALLPVGECHLGIERRNLIVIHKPEEACFVFMRNRSDGQIHLGIWHNGLCVHLSWEGVKLEPLNILRIIYEITFYRPRL